MPVPSAAAAGAGRDAGPVPERSAECWLGLVAHVRGGLGDAGVVCSQQPLCVLHAPVGQVLQGRTADEPGEARGEGRSGQSRLCGDPGHGPAGSRFARLGWFETMAAGLLIATARAGRTDLLTVAPHASPPAARAAMDQAARAGNRTPRPAGRRWYRQPVVGDDAEQVGEHRHVGGDPGCDVPGQEPAQHPFQA
jgi:hypothetical protein